MVTGVAVFGFGEEFGVVCYEESAAFVDDFGVYEGDLLSEFFPVGLVGNLSEAGVEGKVADLLRVCDIWRESLVDTCLLRATC